MWQESRLSISYQGSKVYPYISRIKCISTFYGLQIGSKVYPYISSLTLSRKLGEGQDDDDDDGPPPLEK